MPPSPDPCLSSDKCLRLFPSATRLLLCSLFSFCPGGFFCIGHRVVCLFCLRSVLLVWLVFSGFSYTLCFRLSFCHCSIMSLIPVYRSGWRSIHGPSLCIYHSILSAKDNFFSQICLFVVTADVIILITII